MRPEDIEKQSFAMITERLGQHQPLAEYAPIIKRVIHTTADFDYADNLYFSPGVVNILRNAIAQGAAIVTDTQMAKVGINKAKLGAAGGGNVHCFMADDDVAAAAAARGVTRAVVSMEKAAKLSGPVLFAVGNAPTALIQLCKMAHEGIIHPVGIIGVPVGFVNVVESKNMLMASPIPCIVARGNKGGSNVAAAIVNALVGGYDI